MSAGAASATVHVIVLNYRTPDLTIAAIESLLASETSHLSLTCTIVDNRSADDSVERLRNQFSTIPLIESSHNRGYAGGNNLGIRALLSEIPVTANRDDTYVLLLNSDVVVRSDTVATCVAFLRAHSDVGIVGPKVVLPDGSLDLACRRGFPTPSRALWKLTGLAMRFPNNPRFTGYNLTHLDENETTEVDSVMGAFMLVRLAAIDDAGLLDEDFFMYGEDLDWSYRIKARGWRVFYHPTASVTHLKGASSRRQSYRMIFEFYRAMWLFHRKHYARRQRLPVNLLILLGIAARGALAFAINATRPAGRKRVA